MSSEKIIALWNNYYKQDVLTHNLTLKEGIEMLANQLSLSYEQVINFLYCF